MLVKIISFLIAIAIIPVNLYSNNKNLKFERISVAEGLSAGGVICMLQDSQGFLWIGTQDGLNRFNGYDFKIFKHDPLNSNSLSSNYITAIYEDRKKTIWIGTQKGLNRFNRDTGKFSRYLFKPEEPTSLTENEVSSICETRSGSLLIGTYKIYEFNRDSGKFITYKYVHRLLDTLIPGPIMCTYIFEDKKKNLWIGTNNGVFQFRDHSEKFIHYTLETNYQDSIKYHAISRIYEDRKGVIWVGTYGGGLNRINLKLKTFSHYQYDPNKPGSLSNNQVHSVFEDSKGKLWIGTEDGLNLFNRDKEKFQYYKLNPHNPYTISSNSITTICEDCSGVLWIGTYGGGLNKLVRVRQKFSHYHTDPGSSNSLSHNLVMTFMEDNSGILWIGTYGGLNKLDREKIQFKHFKHHPEKHNSLSNNIIRSIIKDGSGWLWIGTYGGGLNRFNLEKEFFTRYQYAPGSVNSISDNKILDLCQYGKEGLWIATFGKGLDYFIREKEKFIHYKNDPNKPRSLSNNGTRVIYQDKKKVLWIGTWDGGLNKFDNRTGTFTHYKHDPQNPYSISQNIILSICEDKRGILWIGTWGGGLNKFNREKELFSHYKEKDGLPSNVIHCVLEDNQGNLWLSTNNGISKFNPETEKFRNYHEKDGLQSKEFNSGSCYKDSSGRMYFGGINGFNVFYPEDIKDNPHIPPIVLTSLKIFNKEVKLDKDKDISCLKVLKLPYDQNFISFEFAALDYTIPEKNKYAYKLEGLDKNWIYTGAKMRFANYTDLDPGNYIFKVKGSNNDGFWNEEGISVRIIITPPFWKTWWFTSFSVVVFVLLSYLFIHYVKKYFTLITFWKRKTQIGDYTIIDRIGSGGMATVYKAIDARDKSKIVALKVIRDEIMMDAVQRKRFINEGNIIDHLNHPHIVEVIKRGEDNQRLFIAMELLEGQTLAERIKEENNILIKECLKIMDQLVDALLSIHSEGIVHRDLKPENIMLIEKDETKNFVKLLDFGLARDQSLTRLTESGMIVGTINYLPPEQLSHSEFSFPSDIYSLGIIFYELLTREKPFIGETTLDIMKQILEKTPLEPSTFRSEIPGELNELIKKMINKYPDQRPEAEKVKKIIKKFLAT